MRNISYKELMNHFFIVRELSGLKSKKTLLVMTRDFKNVPLTFVLKEVSLTGALVYESILSMWNPYIAEVYEVFQVEGTDAPEGISYYVLMEYVCASHSPREESLSLREYVKKNGPLELKTALIITTQLCDALIDFHEKGLVHRDIKPENIMISEYDLDNPQIKLIDFGGAKEDKPDSIADTTVIGTLGYQAPESLSERTTKRSDIYSIGCVLQFMLTGCDPGLGKYNKNRAIIHIIEKAANEDPSYRYSSLEKLKAAISHELKLHLFDKIPLIREIPGFRTHNFAHSVIASFFYLCFFSATIGMLSAGLYALWAEFTFFAVFIPLVFLFDFGNLIEFLPEALRRNNLLFTLIRYFSVIYIGIVLYLISAIQFFRG